MSDPGNEHCKTRAKHIGAIKKLRADERTSYTVDDLVVGLMNNLHLNITLKISSQSGRK